MFNLHGSAGEMRLCGSERLGREGSNVGLG